MDKFLYIFGYMTPTQHINNASLGWDDEDSEAVWIIAETEEKALEWGREISRKFITILCGQLVGYWHENNFANWIEQNGAAKYGAEQLTRIPWVKYGEYPDIAKMLLKYGDQPR